MSQNFNLTQTGEEVQHILDTATPVTDLQQETLERQQADTLLQQNIDDESTRAQQAEQQEAHARQQAVSTLAAQITQTLTDYYLKSETMSATEIQTLVAETIAAYYTKLQVDALIQDFITASVSNLTNYYLKTETFTKAEVQQLIAAVKQFRYQSVDVLPTASAETMNIIYLVPSDNPKAENVKDEFITTSQTNEQGVTTYQWEQIGSTTVDLSGYSTTEQMNTAISTAISTALASYYTKGETMSTAQVNAAIEQAVNTALASYYTKAQTDAAINAALANYYTKAQADNAITAGIATTLAAYYTKTEVNALLDTIRQSVTAETNARTDADASLRELIQQVSTSLVNYYLKTETYSRSEVQQLVDNVRQFQYKVVTTLPQPTADTVGWIYLVPGSHTETQNVKEEYITILEGSSYMWEHIGSTNVDLSGYSTTQEMNAAIASALASYYTKAQADDVITAAIATALAAYYTKTEINNMLGAKQETLISGTNIKTVNNKSLLGGGNISITDILLVLRNQTSFNDVAQAYISGKIIFSIDLPNGRIYNLTSITNDFATFTCFDYQALIYYSFTLSSSDVYSEIITSEIQGKSFVVGAAISPDGRPSVDKTMTEIIDAWGQGKVVRIRFVHANAGISFEDDATRFYIYHPETESWSTEFVVSTVDDGNHYLLKIFELNDTTQLSFKVLPDNSIVDLTEGEHDSGYYENIMRRVDILRTDTPQIFTYTAYGSDNLASTAICISSCANTASTTANAVFRQRLVLGTSEYVRTLSNVIVDGHYQIVQDWTLQAYLPLTGGAMTGDINMADHELQVRSNRNGIKYVDASTGILVGNANMNTTIQSGNANLKHRKGTINYPILDTSNVRTINGQDVFGTGNIPILQKSDLEALCAALQSAGIIAGYSVMQDANGAYTFSFTAPV